MKTLLFFSGLLFVATAVRAAERKPAPAVAELEPTQGRHVSGRLEFLPENGSGILVRGQIKGLTPGNTHGFHIHEKGDCSGTDASNAGAHFNPTQMPHGGPDDYRRHMGDLGNVQADEGGVARVEIRGADLKLDGTESIVGRSVIVHENPDDLSSQPSGGAGARIACGVIEPAPKKK
jgi:Cu-Zn family superoxide dismutase